MKNLILHAFVQATLATESLQEWQCVMMTGTLDIDAAKSEIWDMLATRNLDLSEEELLKRKQTFFLPKVYKEIEEKTKEVLNSSDKARKGASRE